MQRAAPAGATGDIYLRAVDELVAPLAARRAPDWVLVSRGFDAHRAEPLTGLGLSAGDYGALATRMIQLAPARDGVIVFLEGGYDLDALRDGAAAHRHGAGGRDHRSGRGADLGGPGREVVDAAAGLWRVAPRPSRRSASLGRFGVGGAHLPVGRRLAQQLGQPADGAEQAAHLGGQEDFVA